MNAVDSSNTILEALVLSIEKGTVQMKGEKDVEWAARAVAHSLEVLAAGRQCFRGTGISTQLYETGWKSIGEFVCAGIKSPWDYDSFMDGIAQYSISYGSYKRIQELALNAAKISHDRKIARE